MSVLIEGRDRVYLGAQAWLVEENRELAWAEKHVIKNPALKYVLGRFVEANNANENGHIFDLDELAVAQQTIPNSPLNLLHRPHYIVGNYVASELQFPTQATAAGAELNPFVEALAAFYRYYFPEEYAIVEKAHGEGALFYSMECIPKTVACADTSGCGREFDYDGRTSPTYCAHLNMPAARKILHQPHFTGGALIIPPVAPGWKNADVTELSSLLKERAAEVELAYDAISKELPHLNAHQWESMMASLLAFSHGDGEYARKFTVEQRRKLAKEGKAMPDLSFPIETEEDLANAIKLAHTPAQRAHVAKRAKALGKVAMLPDSWNH